MGDQVSPHPHKADADTNPLRLPRVRAACRQVFVTRVACNATKCLPAVCMHCTPACSPIVGPIEHFRHPKYTHLHCPRMMSKPCVHGLMSSAQPTRLPRHTLWAPHQHPRQLQLLTRNRSSWTATDEHDDAIRICPVKHRRQTAKQDKATATHVCPVWHSRQ